MTAKARAPVTLHLASSGSVRLVVDGVTVGKSDDVHASGKVDRLAVRFTPAAGPHLVAAKVCSGALDDDGRVRLRLEGEGSPAPATSADLSGVPDSRHGSSPRAPAALELEPLGTPLSRALGEATKGATSRSTRP